MGGLFDSIPILGDLFGGYERNKMQNAAAQNQIDWQNVWRSNAHQTEVADLKAAGMNPILTMGSKGAPMGTTQQPQFENIAKGLMTSAKEAKLMAAQLENLKQEAELKKAQQANTNADTLKKDAEGTLFQKIKEGIGKVGEALNSNTGKVIDNLLPSQDKWYERNKALQEGIGNMKRNEQLRKKPQTGPRIRPLG